MLKIKTTYGVFETPNFIEEKLMKLGNGELLKRAKSEHKNFCISPHTFAMIEKRGLLGELSNLLVKSD